MGEVLKCGRGFTLKVNFTGGKNLCAQESGEGGRNHCAQCSYESEPQTQAGPPPSLLLFYHILHQLQHQLLSIFFMLEHFFRPFLKTRSYDRSAHTFGSSHRVLEVPHKGILNKIFVGIFFTLTSGPPTDTWGREVGSGEGHQPLA